MLDQRKTERNLIPPPGWQPSTWAPGEKVVKERRTVFVEPFLKKLSVTSDLFISLLSKTTLLFGGNWLGQNKIVKFHATISTKKLSKIKRNLKIVFSFLSNWFGVFVDFSTHQEGKFYYNYFKVHSKVNRKLFSPFEILIFCLFDVFSKYFQNIL